MNNDNLNEIFNKVKSQNTKQDAEDFLMRQLKPDQSKKLQEVLSDKNAIEQLLNTPQAQGLLKKLMEDKDG